MSLGLDQIAALRELEGMWPDRAIVIIGATALGFHYDMRWRSTADVDLVLAVELDEFPGPLVDIDGWEQHRTNEHQFTSPQGAKIDILPAGPVLLANGSITWASGHRMNLAGMDLALSQTTQVSCLNGYVATVALPTVVAVLKMTSYCDRPHERERDLADLAHLLDEYEDEDSERRWEEAADYSFELASAFLLGLDIGNIAGPGHHAVIDKFLARVGDPEGTEHALMRNRGPAHWSRDEDALSRRLEAFDAGRRRARTPPP